MVGGITIMYPIMAVLYWFIPGSKVSEMPSTTFHFLINLYNFQGIVKNGLFCIENEMPTLRFVVKNRYFCRTMYSTCISSLLYSMG